MNPVTHFFIGWVTANTTSFNRRERILVTIAGFIPDADGFGMLPEYLTRNITHLLLWYSDYHHVLGHNLYFALLVTAGSFLLATRRWKTAIFVFLSFHIHLLGDIIGGRGPDRYQWPIVYLYPVNQGIQLAWQGQYAWQNILITLIALGITFYLAWKRGYSPIEIVSLRADKKFIETLRHRFPSS
ncbi:MAG: metal-dependent hydrolase [bacterium]|nr:metal-dependent hydrolase [bacterium]